MKPIFPLPAQFVPPLLLVLALLTGGCSYKNEALYPSLAPRPIEKIAGTDPAPASTGVKPPDPALARRLDALGGRIAEAEQALDAVIASAAPPAAGAEPGSDEWAENQTTLSRLAANEGALREAGADLGALRSDLAAAWVNGVATAGLTARADALEKQIDAAIARGQQAIDARR